MAVEVATATSEGGVFLFHSLNIFVPLDSPGKATACFNVVTAGLGQQHRPDTNVQGALEVINKETFGCGKGFCCKNDCFLLGVSSVHLLFHVKGSF